MRAPKISSARSLFEANPFGIALWTAASRVWNRLTSAIMGFLLGASGLRLGPGCRILGGRHISFGRGIRAERNLWLEAVTSYRSQRFLPSIVIGDHTCFSDGVHVSSIKSITIGSHVLMGSRIYISDHNHGVYKGNGQSRPDEAPAHRILGGGGAVTIGDNVWIGDNSIILGPVSIGSGAIIGANSVVRGSVPSNSIAVGAPARVIKVYNLQTGTWDKA